jgi:prepilin-type N-terminal cleavage/methylation domain-containing protein
MKRQSGFTLVEIAIVLVIVGLLLAGIIQGSALINSGTAKNLANELKTIPVYVYQYQDKFRALPGDDANANNHVGGSNATTGGTIGNGRIEGSWNSTTNTDESFLFWEHIRRAGLAAGPTNTADAGYAPHNVAGGRVGISSGVPIAGMSGSYFVCSGAVLGKYVRQIDTTLDDGNTDTGSLRAALQSDTANPQTAVASTAINDSQSYNVCMAF